MAKTTEKHTAPANEVPAKKNAAMKVARIYKGTEEVDHDLFKLQVARMKKDVSYDGQMPEFVHFEHCHIYHTVDSNGRKMDETNAVGGHFHKIEVVPASEEGGVPTLKVSAPMKYIKQKKKGVKGKFEKVAVPVEFSDGTIDNHTHEVEYLGSEKIKKRQANVEFAKLDAAMKAQQNPSVEGVLAG